MQKRMSKVTEDRGTEQLSDGRKIPYSRRSYPSENYIVTTYSSDNAADHAKGVSLLVKHERRGKAGWGLVPNGLTMRRGAASSLLGDLWRNPEQRTLLSGRACSALPRNIEGYPHAIYSRLGNS